MRRFFAIAFALAVTLASDVADAADIDQPLKRVAFGSCNREDRPQPLWRLIAATQPDLWIWLGDIVYGDAEKLPDLARRYQSLKEQPDYATLRRGTKVLGVWDDHDYGTSNGGGDNPHKTEVQKLLLDFLDEPPESPRRAQAGVYAAYTFGPPGKQVKVILLDGRFHREPRSFVDAWLGRTTTGDADILGSEQWQWLEQQVANSSADVHLIASGTQVVSSEHRREKWADFPKARQRLLELLGRTRPRNLIFLTGDRHFAEISRLADAPLTQPVFDVTASGMTHHAKDRWYRRFSKEPNRFRLGAIYLGLNFGLIEFDWESSPATAALQIRDSANNVVREEKMSLAPAAATTR